VAIAGVGSALFISAHLGGVDRPDFFYLADAFLHGRTWLSQAFGIYDFVQVGTRFYVPFAPFPAVCLIPLVAFVGPASASQLEPMIDAGLVVF
jgi:hypothetical protein